MWIARGHDVVREIAERDADFVSSQGVLEPWRPATVPVLITSDGAVHQALRAVATPAIRAALTAEPALRAFATTAASRFAEAGGGELVGEVAYPLAAEAVFTLLAIPVADRAPLAVLCRHALSSSPHPVTTAAAATEELIDYLAALAGLRRRAGASDDDLVGRIAGDPSLCDEAVIRYCRLFLEAGLESTSDAMAGAALGLAGRDIDLGPAPPRLIEDILREVSPIARFGRVAARTTTVAGVTIAAGERVMLHWRDANHDPTASGLPHLAFGTGVHRCLGAPLARQVLRVFVEEVLARWGRWRIASATAREGSATHGWDRVDVTLP